MLQDHVLPDKVEGDGYMDIRLPLRLEAQEQLEVERMTQCPRPAHAFAFPGIKGTVAP